MNLLYDMIFKRKSVRRYDDTLHITKEELAKINNKIEELKPLIKEINIKTKIVKKEETTCKIGEYALLIYSEEVDNFLLNIGYMFEQLDLYLASINIGSCWYGWSKIKETALNNKKFVIMIALGKCRDEDFRKDYTKAKRKETAEIWEGDLLDIANIVKYSPSACNSQPWRIVCHNNKLELYRTLDVKGLLKLKNGLIKYYNKIDIGIFMCILEITLDHFGYDFKRDLIIENMKDNLIPIAIYKLEKETPRK